MKEKSSQAGRAIFRYGEIFNVKIKILKLFRFVLIIVRPRVKGPELERVWPAQFKLI